MHRHRVQTRDLLSKGVDLGGRNHNIGKGSRPWRSFPGSQAETGDDVIDFGDLVAYGDPKDLVAVVTHSLWLCDSCCRGKRNADGENERVHHGERRQSVSRSEWLARLRLYHSQALFPHHYI